MTQTQMQCPLCRSIKTRKMESMDVEPVIALWREYYQIDARPEFHNIPQMELWRCDDCEVSFFAPQCLAGSARLYSQLDKFDWYYAPRRWDYDAALKDLKPGQRILEIGCGSGNFIALAKDEAGLFVEGLEQNTEAIKQAAQRGLLVHGATAEDAAKQSPGMYDAVCTFQVLEHIAKPKEFLDACCALLRPGGMLLLGVPNQRSYIRHMINPLDMPPHHMTRWTREPLRRLQAHFPLRLLRVTCEPLSENKAEPYVDTYVGVLQRRGLGFLVPPWVGTRAVRFIRRPGVRVFFKGETIYACYLRT